jgi:UPF0716 family protein affecting phage T7 exclusion
VLVGGAFLLTPGVLTDVVGFSLLLPPSRRWIQARLHRSLEGSIRDGSVRFAFTGPGLWAQRPASTGAPDDLDPEMEIRIETPDA